MSANNSSRRTNFLGYDVFKLVIALILLIILILLLLRGCSSSTVSAGVTQEATTNEPATSQPTEGTGGAATEATGVTPVITSPKDGDSIEGDTITLEGTGAPGSDLDVLDSGKSIGTVTTSGDGTWTFEGPVDAGEHTFVVTTGDGGLKSEPVSVTVGPGKPTATSAPSATPQPTAVPPTSTPAVASGCEGVISGYLVDEEHYLVGSCDTLSGIAVFLNVSVESLLASNPQITNPDVVVPGEIVNVPPDQ